MIPWPLIITSILSLGVMYFLYTFYKTAFKIVSWVMGAFFIALIFLSFFVFQDIKSIREHASDPKLFVLVQDDNVLSALKIASADNPEIMGKSELAVISEQLKAKQFEAAKSNNYQMYIFKTELLERDNFRMELQGSELDHKGVLAVLESGDQNLKAFIFVNIINEYSRGTKLVTAFREGYIIIHPETITFKVVKKIPKSAFEYALSIIPKKGAAKT